MTVLLQNVAGGLAVGSIYALAALGLVLIYKTTDVVNFAQGEMAMVSTFATYVLLTAYDLPYALSVLLALLFAGVLGALIERFIMRTVRQAPVLSQVIVTLGLFMILNGLAGLYFGYDPLSFPRALDGAPLVVGGVFFSPDSLLILGVAVGLALALYLFLKRSMTGVALRATAQKLEIARLMGVPVDRVFGLAWAMAAVLGAVAGILVAPKTALDPHFMGDVTVKSFAAAVLGGFDSLPGAVVGGLLLGVLENLVAGYISTAWKTAFAFGMILLVLVVRPTGLMGSVKCRKV